MFANKQFRILVAFLTLTLCLGLLTVGVRAEEPVIDPVLPESSSEKAEQELKINSASSEIISEEGMMVDIESLEAENAGQVLKETEHSSSLLMSDKEHKELEELRQKAQSGTELTPSEAARLEELKQTIAELEDTSLEPTTTTEGAPTPPWSEDFSSFLPTNWTEAQGILGDPTSLSGSSSSWTGDGFGNVGSSGSARVNIYGTSIDEWMFSPPIDLGTGTAYQLEFDLALTVYAGTGSATLGADDIFAVVISTDGGTTWSSSNVLQQWDSTTPISNGAGDHIVIDLSSYSGTVQLGFYGESTVSNADNDLFVDNVQVKEPSPDLSNSSKEAPTQVVLGDPITYTIAISNTGELPANSATMTDVIPADTTYIADSLSCSSGTCSYNAGEHMIEWDGSVAVGASAEVTFAVDTGSAACGANIVNTAHISDPNALSVVQVSADSDLFFAESFYSTDFEVNDGGFVAQGFDLDTGASATSRWQWGVPNDGPFSANSGVNVWATNLTGDFDDTITDTLTSPTIDLTAYNSALPLILEYSDWRNHYADLESAYVVISTTTTADWVTIWTSQVDQTWTLHQFDIGAHANSGDQLQVRFIWEGNDNALATDGWFVDDLSVYTGCGRVTLEPETASALICPADGATFPLTVANQNTIADNLDITLAGNVWNTTVDPSSLALAAGATDMTTVTVEASGLPDETDMVTVTAMAQTSGLSDMAHIETTALGLGSGWEDRSTSGHGARYLAVVHDNGYIYQIGGNDAGVFYNGTHRYEIASDTWMTMTEMLTATVYMDGAAIDGNIYVPGGVISGNPYNDFVQVYSTTGDSWSTVAPMPVPVSKHEVVALDGLLYVLGGQTTGDTYTDTVQIYDPNSNSWSLGAPMPTAVGYGSSGVIDGKIYVAGGYDGSFIISTLQIYDPATDSWSMGPAMPTTWVQGADGVVADRFLIIAGGWFNSLLRGSSVVWVYDVAWETWYRLPDSNSFRYAGEGASDGSQFYYAAGRESVNSGTSYFYSDRVERLINCGDDMADLELTKTDEEDPAVTDQELSYVLEVTNNGYWGASNVMLTDTLPISTTYLSASPACSEAGGVLTCALGDLDAFDSTMVTVTVMTPSSEGTIVNQATVSADEYDPDLSNNSVSEETTITPIRIDLEKTVGLESGVCADDDTLVLPDGTYDVTYCYNVTNTGTVTLTMHDLSDSELGTLVSGWAYTLTPGASYWLTETATLTETTENTALWTGYDVLSNTASSEASALVDMVLPSIAISKTVGTEAGVCAQDSELLVVAGTEVHYCVEVTNTGALTLSRHTLADSELGNIFTDLAYDLGPGESVTTVDAGITMSTTITTDTTNIATWTAYDELSNSDVATDTATVTVGSPSIELRKGVGTQPGVCATTDSIYVAAGTDVYYCYRVSNTGDITLDTHSLTDSELGDLLTDFSYELEAGAAAFIIFSDTISVETVNDATWTASLGDIEATASDSATVLMTEPDALTCNGGAIEFEAGIPSDWVTANVGNVYWSTTADLSACDNGGNQTNGSGEAACADADQTNSAADSYDSELWTNPFDLDASLVTATLSFEAAYSNLDTGDFFDVDISTDGGATWDNLLSWNEDHFNPGEAVSLDLSTYAGQSGLIVRYRYYGDGFDWYAQVDQVSLNCVEGMSDIDVSPTELASTQYPDMQANEMLTISNMGDGELTWDITIDVDWASVDMATGSTAVGGSSDVTVTFDSTELDPGSYDGTLSIESNDPDEATVDVALMLTVEEAPEAMVEVEIPEIMLKGGQDLEQTMTISNTGDVDFNWEIFTEESTGLHSAGACSGTLPAFPGTTLAPTSGMTPAGGSSDVTMNTDSTDVEPGDYSGNLCVTISESGQVIAIPLTMTVTEPTAVEMAKLSAQATSRISLGFVVAGMMLLMAGGYVVRRRRKA